MATYSVWHWFFVFELFFLGAAVAYIPTFIAYARGHRKQTSILIINLFLGWTIIGWIAALIWALTGRNATDAQRSAG
ncbi:MAG: superinfection immunity protein [Alphaproteobacteria bacterium]